MAGIEQAADDDPDRIGEVDDPRVVRGELADTLGDLEHDGHGPQRLPEAPGPGRFLADAPAGQRNRLVGEPRGLAAYPQLDQHKGGTFEGQVELVRDHELAVLPA